MECDPILWDLISNMLNTDLEKRYNIKQVKEHQYVSLSPNIKLKFIPKKIPQKDSKFPIKTITGEVVDENHIFTLTINRNSKNNLADLPIHKFYSFG